LVVDDNRLSRGRIAGMLETAGHRVTRASSGEEAFSLCMQRRFDLVVSDLEMGGLSGVQLCRILRSDPETAHTRFLLLTARDDPRSRFWSRQAGADDHLSKARMQQELLVRVATLLARPRPGPDGPRRKRGSSPMCRLNEVLERSLFEAVVTGEARRLFELTGDRATLARAVLDLATQLTRARAAAIALPEGGTPERVAKLPVIADAARDAQWLSALGLDARDTDSGRHMILREPEDEGTRAADKPGESLRLPLEVAGERLGELLLMPDSRGLSADDKRTAGLLADAIAPALRQLRLIEETQRLATTDELTGVKNRREIQRRLGHEVARAGRYEVPLTLAMVDVDHFKRVNDSFGHSAGDAVLREVAQALCSGIRKVDLAGRWGGEEFLLVLSDTPLDGGALLADRLRRRVRLATTAADLPCHVTVSIGVAEYEPGLTAEALVDRADQALYRAKDGGRDKVVRYEAEKVVTLAAEA
jgi:two-component system cell cycle response regulator